MQNEYTLSYSRRIIFGILAVALSFKTLFSLIKSVPFIFSTFRLLGSSSSELKAAMLATAPQLLAAPLALAAFVLFAVLLFKPAVKSKLLPAILWLNMFSFMLQGISYTWQHFYLTDSQIKNAASIYYYAAAIINVFLALFYIFLALKTHNNKTASPKSIKLGAILAVTTGVLSVVNYFVYLVQIKNSAPLATSINFNIFTDGIVQPLGIILFPLCILALKPKSSETDDGWPEFSRSPKSAAKLFFGVAAGCAAFWRLGFVLGQTPGSLQYAYNIDKIIIKSTERIIVFTFDFASMLLEIAALALLAAYLFTVHKKTKTPLLYASVSAQILASAGYILYNTYKFSIIKRHLEILEQYAAALKTAAIVGVILVLMFLAVIVRLKSGTKGFLGWVLTAIIICAAAVSAYMFIISAADINKTTNLFTALPHLSRPLGITILALAGNLFKTKQEQIEE